MIPIGTDRAVIRGIEHLQTDNPETPVTVLALQEHTGYSESTIRRATRRLLILGLLRRIDTRRGFFYEVLHGR